MANIVLAQCSLPSSTSPTRALRTRVSKAADTCRASTKRCERSALHVARSGSSPRLIAQQITSLIYSQGYGVFLAKLWDLYARIGQLQQQTLSLLSSTAQVRHQPHKDRSSAVACCLSCHLLLLQSSDILTDAAASRSPAKRGSSAWQRLPALGQMHSRHCAGAQHCCSHQAQQWLSADQQSSSNNCQALCSNRL